MLTISVSELFLLLVLFQLKHFIADFPLQREYMLRKFLPGWDFLLPLAMHCLVHASATLIIVLSMGKSQFWWLAAVDFVAHFTMDRIKAAPHYLGRFNNMHGPGYWNAFGFDQMVHHLTHIYIIWVLATH